MTANLASMADGRVAMVAWGRIPIWHGSGHRSDELMDVPTAAEKCGLFYPVGTFQACWRDDEGTVRDGDGVQIVRTDTMQALGRASKSYVAIPNAGAFTPVIQPFIDSGQIKGVMTAGVIGKGEKAWIQAVVGDFAVDDRDRGISTLLITNDHQANEAVSIGFNATYVVCGNAYSAAQWESAETKNVAKVYHSGGWEAAIARIARSIEFEAKAFRDHEIAARQLAGVDITVKDVWALALAAMPPTDITVQKWKEQREKGEEPHGYFVNQYKAVMNEYFHGPGMDLPTRRDTAFGAWNAVTGYVDYARSPNSTPSERSRMVLMGSGRDIKRRAFDRAFDRWVDGKEWTEEEKEIVSLCPLP